MGTAKAHLWRGGLQQPARAVEGWRAILARWLAPLRGALVRPGGHRTRTTLSYAQWIARFDTLSERDRALIRRHISRFAGYPRLRLLIATNQQGWPALEATLDSIRRQLYRNVAVVVLDQAGVLGAAAENEPNLAEFGPGSRIVPQHRVAARLAELNEACAGHAGDDWVALVPAGDRLAEPALYRFACAALAEPGAAMIYCDDDELGADGARRRPRFKPDWSPEHLRSTHYLGAAVILRARAVAVSGGLTSHCCAHGNYDLVLRVADRAKGPVVHVPAVLYHRGAADADAGEHPHALRAHLARNGIRARVEEIRPGCCRIHYRLPHDPPLVSIIVPTRDAPTLLRGCVESVLRRSSYARHELLVVDNGSTDRYALAYLADLAQRPRVRVLRYGQPFNYSAINNFAARQARGEVLCLLNNDTEVISPDWMEEMLSRLLQPGVGAVGAKLYFRDGRVQHAGDAVGPGGCANHLHPGLERGDPGYCGRALIAQELSAVTGACLMTRKYLYDELGGLDEANLKVAFNDVDYCLRLQHAGYRVVWTPHAELYHHESASRGKDATLSGRLRARREVLCMRARWGARMRHDPYYNPNLSYRQPDFSLSSAPRTEKPWLVLG